jgi:hypothetical protein
MRKSLAADNGINGDLEWKWNEQREGRPNKAEQDDAAQLWPAWLGESREALPEQLFPGPWQS